MRSSALLNSSVLFLAIACLFSAMSLFAWTRETKQAVADVLVVIDVTQSMNVKDVKHDGGYVSRLRFAKRASQEMLLRLPCGSSMGLAMFSGHRSFVMFKSVEICEHHEELWSAIETLDWRSAWVARSEVAKGLFSAMKVLPQISDSARLVFISDGHEAPPLHEKYRPKMPSSADRRGGLIVGVGGNDPVRIPKFGPNGESQGFWRASEVMQVDTYRMGRGNGEALVGVDLSDLDQRLASGREHLSSLKEAHLRTLSMETEMRYATANTIDAFSDAFENPVLWREMQMQKKMSPVFAVCALFFLLGRLLLPYFSLLKNRQ